MVRAGAVLVGRGSGRKLVRRAQSDLWLCSTYKVSAGGYALPQRPTARAGTSSITLPPGYALRTNPIAERLCRSGQPRTDGSTQGTWQCRNRGRPLGPPRLSSHHTLKRPLYHPTSQSYSAAPRSPTATYPEPESATRPPQLRFGYRPAHRGAPPLYRRIRRSR